jgi:hypothetical protein
MEVTTLLALVCFYNYFCVSNKKNDSQRHFFLVAAPVMEEELFPRTLGPDISLFRDLK